MLKTKKGFTLVEVIIAIALIGIIAIGILPVFSTQLNMMINTRKITTTGFDAQGAIEDKVQEIKEMLRPSGELDGETTKESLNIFERQVNMHKINMEYPLNDKKELTVYLSEKLAEMEYRNPLVATLVRIDEEKTDTTVITENVESVSVRASSKLKNVKGVYEIKDYTSSQDLNIYRWYRSKEGISNPQYPADFEFISSWRNKKSITKDELKEYAVNRYIILVLIPVDKSGVRGDEKPSQMVYVQGEEWRSGIFAWVDKNLDGLYEDFKDIALKDIISALKWILLMDFDTQVPFQDPEDPSKNINPEDGSLYVPMGVRRASISDKSGKIEVADSEFINWKVAKSIHVANNIYVKNNSDINMKTTDGTIKLYRFVDIDYKGDVIFGSNGRVALLDKGAELEANNINLIAGDEWGNIILESFTKLTSVQSTQLIAAENIMIDNSTLNAGENILLYSKKEDSVDNIIIKDTEINSGQLVFETSGTMSGGSWNEYTTVVVKNDKTLKIRGWVDNKGNMWLGDTGEITFENNMSEQLEKDMNLYLSKSGNSTVSIGNDYGRNIAYADYSEPEKLNSEGVYQNLGTGKTNLKYKTVQITGNGTPDIYYSFDGSNTISISADKKATEAYINYYELAVADKYAEGAIGTIIFRVSADANSDPTVEIIGSTMPTVKVTFNANGGKFDDGTVAKEIQIENGKPLNLMPENPVRSGFAFVGWNTESDGTGTYVNPEYTVNADITVYAQWSNKKQFTVTFNKNNTTPGSTNANPNTVQVYEGEAIGTLPAPPVRPGYVFRGWNTSSNGSGNTVNENTTITSNITVYAKWSKMHNVRFDANYGSFSDGNEIKTVQIEDGRTLKDYLPTQPTRRNYNFNGWYTTRWFGGSEVDINAPVTGDMTVYARWRWN